MSSPAFRGSTERGTSRRLSPIARRQVRPSRPSRRYRRHVLRDFHRRGGRRPLRVIITGRHGKERRARVRSRPVEARSRQWSRGVRVRESSLGLVGRPGTSRGTSRAPSLSIPAHVRRSLLPVGEPPLPRRLTPAFRVLVGHPSQSGSGERYLIPGFVTRFPVGRVLGPFNPASWVPPNNHSGCRPAPRFTCDPADRAGRSGSQSRRRSR